MHVFPSGYICLQFQRSPRMIVILIALPAHVAMTAFLTFSTSWSYMGAGVAMTLSTALQVILIYLYISFSSTCSRTWRGFSLEAFKNWGPYLAVALPGALDSIDAACQIFFCFTKSIQVRKIAYIGSMHVHIACAHVHTKRERYRLIHAHILHIQ